MTKNFTVIGNILFAHIFTNEVAPAVNICEIPPAIVERIIQHSAEGFTQTLDFGGVGEVFYGTIKKEGNKYYIISNTTIQQPCYIMFYVFLKDI